MNGNTARRRAGRFAEHRVLAALLVIAALGGACWLGKGRGVKSWIGKAVGLAPAARREPPRVIVSRPADGERAVPPDGRIAVKVYLPNGRLVPTTLNAESVTLTRADDGAAVRASVTTSPDGVFIIVKPSARLGGDTRYTCRITSGVRDHAGTKFLPFEMSFTTGGVPDPAVRFEKVARPAAADAGFTCVQVGPDGRLYAGADDGRIFRYDIAADGVPGSPTVITSLRDANNGPRLLTGFCFDPRSDPRRPTLWASHGHPGFADVPDWTGKISRLSGAGLAEVRDVVVHLPRSVRDHLTNQPTFGPDGALYIPQPSNTASGAADAVWGDRPERLLSATILRLDVDHVTDGPIDAKTADGGGGYDPGAPGAPLTVYADGARLAYDLLWHSNGHLYAPVNGASAGGNTPAGDGAPALCNIPTSEHDWLFNIRPGRYYGHPNPVAGHYVLNGGNPSAATDAAEVPQYPVGTRPDPQWDPPVYDFGDHVSPNGIIEYRSHAFGGRLRNRLLVCRYNAGSDILCLTLDADGNVSSSTAGIPGLTGLTNPLDLAEDARTGCIYVAEYGARRITLMRPVDAAAVARAVKTDAKALTAPDCVAPSGQPAPTSPHR
jgi:glucose/arabinose dehydrogenase